MIAVDTNVLVYAHRRDGPFHARAREAVAGLAEGPEPWALPWPCIHEFVAIVTNPRIFERPTPVPLALEQARAWLGSPRLELLAEREGYWEVFRALVEQGEVRGAKVHDVRVAALCVLHNVRELWTADRDFSRFRQLATRNPCVP